MPKHPASTSTKTHDPSRTTLTWDKPEIDQGPKAILNIKPRTLRSNRSSPGPWRQLLDEIRVRRPKAG